MAKQKRLEDTKAELTLSKLCFQAQQIKAKMDEKAELSEAVETLEEEASSLEKELNEAGPERQASEEEHEGCEGPVSEEAGQPERCAVSWRRGRSTRSSRS